MPLHSLTTLWKRIPRTARTAFAASLCIGGAVYAFAMTNFILCAGDALTNTYFDGVLVWMGRWSSQLLSSFSTSWSMPLVNGLIMLLAISVLSGLTAVLLECKGRASAMLIAAVLTCYPSVGQTITYLHNADAYMLGAMLSAAAVLLADRHPFRLWPLLAVPLFAVGMGAYQSNLSLAAGLMFVRAVQLILSDRYDDRTLIKQALRYIGLTAASVAAYYGMALLTCRLTGIPLSSYRSMNAMGSFSPSELLRNWLGTYGDFKGALSFLSYRPDFYVSGYPNYLFLLLTMGLAAGSYLLCRRKTVLKAIVLIALLLLCPTLLCSIRLANPGVVYGLMTYSVCGLYLLGIVLTELTEARLTFAVSALPWIPERFTRNAFTLVCWVLILCLVLALVVWCVGSNLDFYRGKLEYENLYAQCSTYLALAEAAEDYTPGMPVYVIGNTAEATSRRTPALSQPKYYYAFMHYYLSVNMPYGVANDIDDAASRIKGTDAFMAMPVYPHEGCARVIDGAAVVKLSAQ